MPQPWERRRVVYRRPIGAVPVRRPDEEPEAYAARREEDVQRQVEASREAYERGRRDGRHSKKSHPILTLVVVALAVLGLVFVGLWVRSGSPSAAGEQIGAAAEVAADRTEEAARVGAERGGEALRDAGDRAQDRLADDEAPADAPAPATEATTTTTTSTTAPAPAR